ncbi:MAG: hypothetical protein U1F11_14935, partial [Steroidobacteraceae bacterium]
RSSGRQAQLLGGTLLPQAEANYRSALASYEVAEVDFGTLLESLRQWTSSRLELLDLQLQNQIAAARIARLTGEAP